MINSAFQLINNLLSLGHSLLKFLFFCCFAFVVYQVPQVHKSMQPAVTAAAPTLKKMESAGKKARVVAVKAGILAPPPGYLKRAEKATLKVFGLIAERLGNVCLYLGDRVLSAAITAAVGLLIAYAAKKAVVG
jgi:hypothetical protein